MAPLDYTVSLRWSLRSKFALSLRTWERQVLVVQQYQIWVTHMIRTNSTSVPFLKTPTFKTIYCLKLPTIFCFTDL